MDLVDLEELDETDDERVRNLVSEHVARTGSMVGRNIVASWERARERFVKVMPRDYKRALAAMQRAREEGIPWERAVMEGAHG